MQQGSLAAHAKRAALLCGVLSAVAATACGDDDALIAPAPAPVALASHSATPALVKNVLAGVDVYSLLSSEDVLAASPNWVFGGSADGSGLMRNADGSYTLLVNNEDNYSVSRVRLDSTFKPVRGDYLMNSDGGRWRLCSATLAAPAVHGFGPLSFTADETDRESQIHAVNPEGSLNSSTIVTAFGRWNAEQALPLPAAAYANRTVVLIGDDGSDAFGGQLAMYVGRSVGDLTGGNLYALARTDDNIRERDMVVGQRYDVEFRQIANQQSLSGAQIDSAGARLNVIRFGRVEDVDYRKGSSANAREVYFVVTGQANTGVNADDSRSKYGRVYRLRLDAADPLKATLEVVLDGDDRAGPARQFQNPDNIYVGQNYLYVQEDPNGYGDETHDAYIYQYDIAARSVRVAMELDHRRTAADAAKYNTTGQGNYAFRASTFGSWEYGALIDVSDQVGIPDTFVLSVQPHTWRAERYRRPDGGSLRAAEDQASQLLVLKGLPR
jgi:hypothetical protein